MSSLPFSVLYISNVNETYDFWSKLGFEILKKEVDKVVVNISGFELHYILDSTEPFKEYLFNTVKENRSRGAILYFEIELIESFYEKVKSLNPKILTKIKENLWDGLEFLFSDPDGYLFAAYKIQ